MNPQFFKFCNSNRSQYYMFMRKNNYIYPMGNLIYYYRIERYFFRWDITQQEKETIGSSIEIKVDQKVKEYVLNKTNIEFVRVYFKNTHNISFSDDK